MQKLLPLKFIPGTPAPTPVMQNFLPLKFLPCTPAPLPDMANLPPHHNMVPATTSKAFRICPISSANRGKKRKLQHHELSNTKPAKAARILLDSGADTCCVSSPKFLSRVYDCQPWPVMGVTGSMTIRQRGALTFHSANGPKIRKIKLNNVPVIHGSPHDIIVGQSLLEPEGSQTVRIGTTLRIIDASMTTIITADKSGALYYIEQPRDSREILQNPRGINQTQAIRPKVASFPESLASATWPHQRQKNRTNRQTWLDTWSRAR
jgi:hypothetical protein